MAKAQPDRLILASGSPARRELLTQAGYSFDVRPANLYEPSGIGVTDIRAFVHEVAWKKAALVATEVDAGVVIAADTVGWLNSQVIGKPEDEEDARRILNRLGGTVHEIWTGTVLWGRPGNVQICWQESSRVAFKRLTGAELDGYLASRTWRGCSGAYAIEGRDDPFVRLVSGSLSNVIGLPMEMLARLLPLLAHRRPASLVE
jgi:septum formation protein